jgi:hypothetical protein
MKFPDGVLKALRSREDEISKEVAQRKALDAQRAKDEAEEEAKNLPPVFQAASHGYQDSENDDASDFDESELEFEDPPRQLDVVNTYELRREWMKLSIAHQRNIVKALKIPVILPRFMGRYNGPMQKAYDEVFEYVMEKQIVDQFAKAIGV